MVLSIGSISSPKPEDHRVHVLDICCKKRQERKPLIYHFLAYRL